MNLPNFIDVSLELIEQVVDDVSSHDFNTDFLSIVLCVWKNLHIECQNRSESMKKYIRIPLLKSLFFTLSSLSYPLLRAVSLL